LKVIGGVGGGERRGDHPHKQQNRNLNVSAVKTKAVMLCYVGLAGFITLAYHSAVALLWHLIENPEGVVRT
jgi:hypothetical protein